MRVTTNDREFSGDGSRHGVGCANGSSESGVVTHYSQLRAGERTGSPNSLGSGNRENVVGIGEAVGVKRQDGC